MSSPKKNQQVKCGWIRMPQDFQVASHRPSSPEESHIGNKGNMYPKLGASNFTHLNKYS